MTRSLHVLALNCEFPPLGGGAASVTWHLLRALEEFPVHVSLVTASEGEGRTEQFTSRCLVHRVPVGKAAPHYWTNRELLKYSLAAFRCVRRLRRGGEEFDLCHAFFTVPCGAVAWCIKRRLAYIISLQGSDVPGFSGRYRWFYRVARPPFRKIWKDAEAVVANSPELARLARQTAPRLRFEVIPNGVDVERFSPGERPGGGPVLLSVARLIPRKDLETCIRAAALLSHDFPGLRLLIAGDGPLRGALEELAAAAGVADTVEFLGAVPRESMPELYRRADLFMLTSHREGMSITMLEALASGLPVVASRKALSGIELPGAATVAPGDAPAAAEQARRLLLDENARSRAARASRQSAQRYTWRAIAQEYFQLYRRAAGRPRAGPL